MTRTLRLLARGALALIASVPFAITSSSAAAVDPRPVSPATFQVTENTQVPGHRLKPGSYSITVVDQLSDRMVLRVNDSSGKELATFIGLPGGSRLPKQSPEGPISMAAKGGSKVALRGFAFANGSVAEFVYPKVEAVALAKANSTTIPAVDPASEGRVASPNLSRTDMELVTLWMLTPTVVGADHQPAIEAKRYQDTAEAQAQPATRSAAASSEMAQAAPPPVPAARPRPVAHPVAALPHTGSNEPLILLAGLFAMIAACGLRLRRVVCRA